MFLKHLNEFPYFKNVPPYPLEHSHPFSPACLALNIEQVTSFGQNKRSLVKSRTNSSEVDDSVSCVVSKI